MMQIFTRLWVSSTVVDKSIPRCDRSTLNLSSQSESSTSQIAIDAKSGLQKAAEVLNLTQRSMPEFLVDLKFAL